MTRRHDIILATFDALNHAVQRVLPAKEYPLDTNSSWKVLNWRFPQYSNCADHTGYCIPADTATFAYDRVGDMTLANNGDAQITRVYNSDGTLAADTLRIRAWAAADFSLHVYGLTYTYDLDGRRLTFNHPATIAPTSGGVVLGQQQYTYDGGGVGVLTNVTDVLGYDFTYQYDLDQRVVHVGSEAAIEHSTFDADGRLQERVDSATNVSPVDGWQYNTLHDNVYYYDLRGNIVRASGRDTSEQLETVNAYSGLGALDDGLIRPLNDPNPGQFDHTDEWVRSDAFGNPYHRWSDTRNGGTYGDSAQSALVFRYEPGSGRLLAQGQTGGVPYYSDAASFTYDSSGNEVSTFHTRNYLSGGINYRIDIGVDEYYDAAQHLRAMDKRECVPGFGPGGSCAALYSTLSDIPHFEEFRYDALGRRILQTTLGDSLCVGAGAFRSGIGCQGAIERTVYDGDQVLYEIRMPDSVGISPSDLERDTGAVITYEDTTFQFGRVGYTHGLGLDQPLDIIRMGYDTLFAGPQQVVPLRDWRGGYDISAFALGARYQCSEEPDSLAFAMNGAVLCFQVQPGDLQYGLFHQDRFVGTLASHQPYWTGSLIADKRDMNNRLYMRNRYYDPQTGRFTQEDPIGLAGGLNAYGFAAGDPVNYSDPFGLDPCMTRGNCTQVQGGEREGNANDLKTLGKMFVSGLKIMLDLYVLGAFEPEKEVEAGAAAAAEEGAAGAEAAEWPAAAEGETRVSRWMSEGEYKQMRSTGTLQVGAEGRTSVTLPGAPKPGGTSNVRVDFNIQSGALQPGGNMNWKIIFGGNRIPINGIQRVTSPQ